MRERPGAFLMPRAKSARGKVRGALPRTPARGKPPETPARFPFCLIFQNGPRRQGCAPKNLFKGGKDFSPPRSNRAPLTAPGRSEDWLVIRKSGLMQSQNPPRLRVCAASRWSAQSGFNQFGGATPPTTQPDRSRANKTGHLDMLITAIYTCSALCTILPFTIVKTERMFLISASGTVK